MARKKAKSATDENSIKEIYSNKNYIPPKEIELETISEDSQEEKDSENDISPPRNRNLTSSSNEDLKIKADTTFSATGVGSRVGARISSRRASSICASQIPAKKVERSSNSEVRKIDNVPYWQGNKTKDRKRRAMISKQMNGRKKYKWKGLTEEEEDQMEYMLLNCEKSPLKNLSPHKFSPRKSILAEIKDDSNIVGNASSNSQEDYPQVSSHTGTSQDSRPCDGVHISDPTTNLNPDGKFELSSTYDSDSLAQLNIDLFQSIPENISQKLPKPKASREKNKRRSNSFAPVTNKLIKEENNLIEATIEQVVIGTCQNYCNKTIQPYEAEHSDNKENALRLTSTNETENVIQKSIDVSVKEYSPPDFKGFKSDEALTPKKCDSSILHHSGTFLDDSYMLKQVNEADKLLGGLLDSTICKSRSASPIFDDLTLKKTARSSMKVHSVRRSSRLFRSKQSGNDSEDNENYRIRGSVFTEVELNIKSRIKK